jgi:hypothetical protein
MDTFQIFDSLSKTLSRKRDLDIENWVVLYLEKKKKKKKKTPNIM